MDFEALSAVLRLAPPWYMNSAEACRATGTLYLGLAYPEDGRFTCSQCGLAGCVPELSWPRVWVCAGFFGYRAYLMARMPDVACDVCGIVPARADWEHPELGFTLLRSSPARPGLAEWCRGACPPLDPPGSAHRLEILSLSTLTGRPELGTES